MEQTPYLILRKVPFQESSLIVSGISPDYGRLDFLLRGARSSGAKKFPTADLFRECMVSFREKKSSTLQTPVLFEPLCGFDTIALHTKSYMAACLYGAYLLKHVPGRMSCPVLFRIVKTFLERVSASDDPEPHLTLAYLGYADEAGELPEPPGESEQRLLAELLAAARGDGPVPELTDSYQKRLSIWVHALQKD